jgi:hypothetical protein
VLCFAGTQKRSNKGVADESWIGPACKSVYELKENLAVFWTKEVVVESKWLNFW